MRRLIFILLLWASPAFASRDFTAASSQRILVDTSLGNWEYTQAWTETFWIYPKTNASGCVLCKQDNSGNFRGWSVFTSAGATGPRIQVDISNTGALHASARTTAELSLTTWTQVTVTYSGSGTEAGIAIYFAGASQSLSNQADTLAANTILNSNPAFVGARGASGAPGFFPNHKLRRLTLHNVVLSGSEITTMAAGTAIVKTGLQFWEEYDANNQGATMLSDWSGNNHVGFNTSTTYDGAIDPSITALLPQSGLAGVASLSGPLIRAASPPLMQNLGWVLGANNGQADQIGPGFIIKGPVTGAGDSVNYRCWCENDSGTKTLDPGNQGAPDFDTPTLYGISSDGLTWSFPTQDVPASSIFNVNNISTNLMGAALTTFKAAIKAETSISTMIYDNDCPCWKAWFHGGNNSGVRAIYLATTTGDPTGANWNVANNGAVVLANSGNTWDIGGIADAKVVKINSSLMFMMYVCENAGQSVAQICEATSSDQGFHFTAVMGNPVIPVGSAGTWDAATTTPGMPIFDGPTQAYFMWGGGVNTGAFTNSMGFWSSTDHLTWTPGAFNPVMNGKDGSAANANLEFIRGTSSSTYLDGTTYRVWDRGDNGVSLSPGFRGRLLSTMPQTFTGTGGGPMMLLGVP